LSYANLYPDTPKTLPGQLFLWTNLGYGLIGYIIFQEYNNVFFGALCEIIALLSYNYHYQQLLNIDRDAVRLSLLCDYIGAAITILVGLYYVIIQPLLLFLSTSTSSPQYMDISSMLLNLQSLQLECVILSIVSVLLLISCWIYEVGRPYMILHGLWHIASAYAGYLIGTYHYHYVTMLTNLIPQ
jgi:hypothetical protein